MKGKFKKYSYHPWYRACRRVCAQFILPFVIFELVRILLLPTLFDLFLLFLFTTIAICLFFEII